MAATNEIIIKNNGNSKQFLFRGVVPYKIKKSQPTISIPLINTGPENNVLFRFTGQTEDINFSFALFDDGTDVSNGTHTSTVETVAEQEQYLKNEIFTEEFDTDWDLWDGIDLMYPAASAITGNIENIDWDNNVNAQVFATGTLFFKRGRIGSL